MSNKIQICNQALAQLGEGPIVSFDDNTDPANALSVMYEPAKKAVLRSYHWNCATRTATLAKLDETPVDSQWEYVFSAPNKNLRIIEIIENGYPLTYRTQWDVQGNKIYTKSDNVAAKYIENIAESQLDAHVEMVLVACLVKDLAYTITESTARETNATELYDMKLQEARTTDGLEISHRLTRTDQLDLVRR